MIHKKTTKFRPCFFKEDNGRLFFIALILAVMGMGIVYRTIGINNSLWLDEAMWARTLVNDPLIKWGFRPVGFMAVTKVLINIRNNEFILRLVPYLSSIFTIFLTYLVAKEIFKSKITIFLSVFIVSFNPILISYAKEFKPYSLELSLHLLVILVILFYIKKKIGLTAYHIIGMLLIALPFAYNIVFLYPSVFLLLLLEAYQEKKIKEFFTLAFIVCLGLGGLLLLYFVFWSSFTGESTKVFWGKKYDVFYLSNDVISHVKWIIVKYLKLIWSSGRAEVFWDFISIKYPTQFRWSFGTDIVGDRIINATLLIAHCIGFTYLIFKKKIKYLLIFVFPVFVVILFNILGIWPFGPFRTNLFLFCYFLIISLYGIDVVINTSNTRFNWCTNVFIVITVILLQLPFEPEYYKLKMQIPNSDMKSVLNTIFNMDQMDRLGHSNKPERQKRIIIAEVHSYEQIKYYLENHSEFSKKNKKILDNYKISGVRRMRDINTRDYLNNSEPVWIVNSYSSDINKADKYLVKDNIIFHRIFKKDQNELIYYLPHSVSNILTFDHESGFGGIRGLTEMNIKTEMRNGKEVLIARASGKDSCLEIQGIKYLKDRFLSISAHIESPAWTDSRIFYMTESEKQYSESKSVTIWIEYGKNNLNAVINDKNIYGEIRMCPGKVPGDYVISEINIGAVDNL